MSSGILLELRQQGVARARVVTPIRGIQSLLTIDVVNFLLMAAAFGCP